MSRGKAYNIWKKRSKYVSRLKKHMYYWLVQDNEMPYKGSKWRKPYSWKELDEKGGHSKLLKKTVCIVKKNKWEKVYDHQRIKDLRDESKKIINEELKK